MAGLSDAFDRPDGVYLLNHSVGVPPRSITAQVADRVMSEWMTDPEHAWPRWMAELDGFHAELARLFNHQAEWFCHQMNVSSGFTKVLHSLPVEPSRPVIVLSELAFPSLGYVAEAASAAGYELRFLPRDLDTADPQVWIDAISADVAVVLVGHAESNTGRQLPVGEITRATRASGVVSVVDVAQSAGLLPVDLQVWQADVVVGTSVKWLSGGPGAGFLWVAPEMIDRCRPLDVGWFSHEDPFAFDIREFRFAPDARRFWGGTPSPIPAALARHSIAAINDIGVAVIHEHNLTMTQRLIGHLDEYMLVSPREPQLRSGTVVIDPGTENREALLAAFADAHIQVDERSDGIRVSPHIVNTLADIDATFDVINRSTTG